MRQLNNEITAKRNVRFYAFSLVRADGVDFENSRKRQMEWLKEQGFETVEYHMVNAGTIEEEVAWFADQIQKNEVPSDGLVLLYDDICLRPVFRKYCQNSPGIPSLLNGRMKSGRRRFGRSNGVRPGQG